MVVNEVHGCLGVGPVDPATLAVHDRVHLAGRPRPNPVLNAGRVENPIPHAIEHDADDVGDGQQKPGRDRRACPRRGDAVDTESCT